MKDFIATPIGATGKTWLGAIVLVALVSVGYFERGFPGGLRVSDKGIQILLFGFLPYWTVPFHTIVEIRRVRLGQSFRDPDSLASFTMQS